MMEKLKRHLGVTYKWEKVNGVTIMEASMPKLEDEIIMAYDNLMKKIVKEHPTPGYSGKILTKHEGDPVNLKEYRSLIGQLLYYMAKVAPEVANPCRELSSYMDCPSKEHWKCIKRAVGYIKLCKGKGVKTKTPKDLTIISYCDSNYATKPDDRKSISGMIHTIGGMLLNWCSRKQKIVTLSSTKAEYVALSESQETQFEWMLLNKLTGATKPAIIYEDNTGAIF